MWAQDRNKVYITIKLQDIKGESINFDERSFTFKGHANDSDFDFKLELFNDIYHNVEETKYVKFGRYTQLTLRKKDTNTWWPRLAKTAQKLPFVGIDWSKWVDDDREGDEKIPSGEVELPNTPDEEFSDSSDKELSE